jgi:hypothetical protein
MCFLEGLSPPEPVPTAPHCSISDPINDEIDRASGGRDVSTTMIYTHVLNRGPAAVRSPADRMLGV